MDIWSQLIEAAERNKAVTVTLSPDAEIKSPGRQKRPTGGRPRIFGASRWSAYAGWNPELPSRRPRCQAMRCSKYLRRDQAIACCGAHEARALAVAAGQPGGRPRSG
jgi:hypothetical protein